MLKKQLSRIKRKSSIRKRISGTASIPRLSIYRSNKHLFAQLIDDTIHKSILGLSSAKLDSKGTKTATAEVLGKKIAELLKDNKIDQIVFDRSGYKYHGRVKAFAESLREGGIKF